MRVLCLDVGDRRIGLAIGDSEGRLAVPVGFIERRRLRQDIAAVLQHAEEREAGSLVVGIPLSMNGTSGPQAKKVMSFVQALKGHTDLPVHTADERLSSNEAERLLRQASRHPSRHRGQVDAAAAAVILQQYLDERRDGAPAKGDVNSFIMMSDTDKVSRCESSHQRYLVPGGWLRSQESPGWPSND